MDLRLSGVHNWIYELRALSSTALQKWIISLFIKLYWKLTASPRVLQSSLLKLKSEKTSWLKWRGGRGREREGGGGRGRERKGVLPPALHVTPLDYQTSQFSNYMWGLEFYQTSVLWMILTYRHCLGAVQVSRSHCFRVIGKLQESATYRINTWLIYNVKG